MQLLDEMPSTRRLPAGLGPQRQDSSGVSRGLPAILSSCPAAPRPWCQGAAVPELQAELDWRVPILMERNRISRLRAGGALLPSCLVIAHRVLVLRRAMRRYMPHSLPFQDPSLLPTP